MRKNELKQKTADLTREAAAGANDMTETKLSELLPDIVTSVRLDREYMLEYLKTNISVKSIFGLLNKMLDMLGFQIINVRDIKEHKVKKPEIDIKPEGDAMWENCLTVDETAYKKAAKQMLDIISEAGKKNREKYSELEFLHRQACGQRDSKAKELEGLRTYTGNMRKHAAESIQTILSLTDGENTALSTQIDALLDDLRMSVCHECGDTARSDMFMTLKCADPSRQREKPCIMSEDGTVLAQGLKFIADSADEA